MTKEEFREVDKKVAVELGWTSITPACGVNLEIGFDWMGISPTGDRLPVPRYSTVAQSADLVRQEIERRGWVYCSGSALLQSYLDNGMVGDSSHFALVWAPDSDGDWSHVCKCFAHADSPYIALCIAFLKACEATKEA